MLTNIHFPLTYFGAGSSLRLLWSLPALFSLPFYVKEGPKISRCHFWLTETCLPASSRWLSREGPPSLLPAQSRISQSYPLLCLDQMRKTELIGTFSEKCIFAGTCCLAKPFHEDTINSLFFCCFFLSEQLSVINFDLKIGERQRLGERRRIIQNPHLFSPKADISQKRRKVFGFCSDVESTQEMKWRSAQFCPIVRNTAD